MYVQSYVLCVCVYIYMLKSSMDETQQIHFHLQKMRKKDIIRSLTTQ